MGTLLEYMQQQLIPNKFDFQNSQNGSLGPNYQQPNKYDIFTEIGTTGTQIFSGVINEEYLQEWQNIDSKCAIVDRMLKSDATVKAIHLVMTLPLESARWEIEADEHASSQDKAIAEQVKEMFFKGMTVTWQDTLREILMCLPYGFSLMEQVLEPDPVNKKIVRLKKLAPRIQKTIKKWFTDDTGGLAGVEQRAYYVAEDKTVYKTVRIPVEKLVLFSYRQLGSDFEGQSILRPAYKHWFIKDKLYLIQAIGMERFALGVPVVYLPRGSSPNDKAAALKLIKSWRGSHEEAGEVFPEGVKVESIQGSIQSAQLDAAIQHHDSQITKAVLGQFLQLGTGTTGSWALSKDQSDFFLMSLNGIAKFVCDRINEYVIKPLVKVNWGKREMYPELRCEDISKQSNDDMLRTLQTLLASGIVEKDPGMEDWARKTFTLPAKEDMDLSGLYEQAKQEQSAQSQTPDKVVQKQPTEVEQLSDMLDQKKELVRNTLNDLIKLRENMQTQKFEAEYALNTLEQDMDEAALEAFKSLVPRITKVLQNKFGGEVNAVDVGSALYPMFKETKDSAKAYAGGVISHSLYGTPMPGEDPLAFAEEDITQVDEPIFTPKTQAQMQHAAYNNAHAPVVKDPKTGKYKYAKGAVVGGQAVGGQWAPVAGGGAVGGAVYFASKLLLGSSKNATKKIAKNGVQDKMGEWAVSPSGRNFYSKLGLIVPDDYANLKNMSRSLYKVTDFRLSGLFTEDILPHGRTSFEHSLKEAGITPADKTKWFRDFKLTYTDGAVKDTRPIWEMLDDNHPAKPKLVSVLSNHKIDTVFNKKTGAIESVGNGIKAFGNLVQKDGAEKHYATKIKGAVAAGDGVLIGTFMGLATGYLVDAVWESVMVKASKKLHDKIRTVSEGAHSVMTPEEAAEYNRQWEEMQKKLSPTGGKVGRPRVNPGIPSNLKAKKGRPSLHDKKKVAEIKKQRAEYINKWRKENVQSGGQSNSI